MTKSQSVLLTIVLCGVQGWLVTAREDTFLNRQKCFLEFAIAGFEIFEYDRYPSFFTEDSFMQLAQAGKFFGPAGIEEYVRFADATSPYTKNSLDLDQNAVVITGSDPTTGECVMLVNGVISYELDETTAVGQIHSVGFLFKIFFEPKGFFQGVTISKINVFFDGRFLEDYFNRLLNTDQTRNSICDTMESACPDTWDLNELDSVPECKSRLSALPVVGDNLDVSGNTQGCRVVHAAIARLNNFHCAHISLVAQEDPAGALKCREAAGILPTDLFDEDDFIVFYDRMTALGFENGYPYAICDCQNLSARERFYQAFRFDAVWELINRLSPLPPTWIAVAGINPLPKCSLC